MRKLAGVSALVGFSAVVLAGQVADTIPGPLQQGQYDLAGTGRAFLLDEASRASFFMPGELHGENEIPALIRNIWPSMPEATFVTSLKRDQTAVLWGRDIEEAQPHLLIRELPASNPASTRRQWRGA